MYKGLPCTLSVNYSVPIRTLSNFYELYWILKGELTGAKVAPRERLDLILTTNILFLNLNKLYAL
jgi:hypothetical protein